MRKQDNETSIDFIRRVVQWLNCEQESVLAGLPTVQAVFEYAELLAVYYNADSMSEILDAIAEGDDPKPLQFFITRHKIPNWKIPQHVLDAHKEALAAR